MGYPSEYRYSKEHEWVLVEGEVATVGITEFAQEELGDVVFVELPEEGDAFDTDDEVGSIESVKAVAEIYTPVAGEVTEINDILEDDPALVNKDPHVEGWLFKIKMSDPTEAEGLMDATAYESFASTGDE